MIVEQGFENGLAIIEIAFNGDVVNGGTVHCGHLPALDIAHPAMGMKNDGRGIPAVLEGVDGRTSGISRGGAHNGCVTFALLERPVHQARQQLHGHILEGQSWSMEKFEKPLISIELFQGNDCGVIEGGVGLGNHLLQFDLGNCAAGEFRNYMEGHVLIGSPAKATQFLGRNLRPRLWNIETTITGKAGEQNIFKAKLRGPAPGGYILH